VRGEWGEDRPVPGANRPLITPLPRVYAGTYAAAMPVIVVGADTPLGAVIVEALTSRNGEIRAFVSDPGTGRRLREAGIKVAVGDVSDGSHVAGAALNCFSAVLLAGAASDGRERSFADDPDQVLEVWVDAIAEAGVQRAIWVGRMPNRSNETPETALVEVGDRSPADIAAEITDLDDRPRL